MNQNELIAKRDLFLCDIVEKYSEWIEMTDEPSYFLVEVLAALLMKSEEENQFLRNKLCNKVP